ncbi:unnamed protein product, partial [Adineta ricciae]
MAFWTRQKDSNFFEIAELIISGVFPIALIVVGTIGNVLSAIILLNKQNRQTSTNIYLIFLCCMDTLSLYQWNLRDAAYEFTDGARQISNQSVFLCICQQFLAFYTLHASAMFLTLVSLDRACLLWSRRYKQKIARARVAVMIGIVILVLLFGINGFLFKLGFEYSYYDNATATYVTIVTCSSSTNPNITQFFYNVYPWIHLVIMYFLPFTLMVFCTIISARKLIVRQTSVNQQIATNAQRNRRISIMLLLMCFTYIILTLPNRLCFSVFVTQLIGHDYSDTVFLLSNTLMYTRSALNVFFLYISVYGFQRDVRRLFSKCYGWTGNRVVPRQGIMEEQIGTVSRL